MTGHVINCVGVSFVLNNILIILSVLGSKYMPNMYLEYYLECSYVPNTKQNAMTKYVIQGTAYIR